MKDLVSLLANLDYETIIATMGVEEIVKVSVEKGKNFIKNYNFRPKEENESLELMNEEEMFARLNSIMTESINWSNLIQFRDLEKKR